MSGEVIVKLAFMNGRPESFAIEIRAMMHIEKYEMKGILSRTWVVAKSYGLENIDESSA